MRQNRLTSSVATYGICLLSGMKFHIRNQRCRQTHDGSIVADIQLSLRAQRNCLADLRGGLNGCSKNDAGGYEQGAMMAIHFQESPRV